MKQRRANLAIVMSAVALVMSLGLNGAYAASGLINGSQVLCAWRAGR